ncbi:MAG: hypothetical protein DME06_19670, partial [Candidatus Rokuibacteriota bacterium]
MDIQRGMDRAGVDRRGFLRLSAAAACVGLAGIEGILAARRAPAWA